MVCRGPRSDSTQVDSPSLVFCSVVIRRQSCGTIRFHGSSRSERLEVAGVPSLSQRLSFIRFPWIKVTELDEKILRSFSMWGGRSTRRHAPEAPSCRDLNYLTSSPTSDVPYWFPPVDSASRLLGECAPNLGISTNPLALVSRPRCNLPFYP